jgi:hypothetical protein
MPAAKKQTHRMDATTSKGKIMKTRTTLSIFVLVLASLTLGAMQAQAIIIINSRPVGITLGQSARLTFADIGETRGFIVNWRFIDADGVTVVQSERPITVPFGKMISVDLDRDTLRRPDSRVQIRVEVEVLTPGNPDKNLSTSLEVFNNDTGETTFFVDPWLMQG